MTPSANTRRSPEYQRAAVTYAAALRRRMRERDVTRNGLARCVGISGEAVGNYLRARYLPRPDIADRIADVLVSPALSQMAATGRRIRCAFCGRSTWRGTSRRRYCGDQCRDRAKPAIPAGYAAPQAAIDTFCGSCEPEGVCRTPACPLQPFSPLPLIHVRRAGAA